MTTVDKQWLDETIMELTEDYNKNIEFNKWRNRDLETHILYSMPNQILWRTSDMFKGTEHEETGLDYGWGEYLSLIGENEKEELLIGFFNKYKALNGSDPEPFPSQSYKEAMELIHGGKMTQEMKLETLRWYYKYVGLTEDN